MCLRPRCAVGAASSLTSTSTMDLAEDLSRKHQDLAEDLSRKHRDLAEDLSRKHQDSQTERLLHCCACDASAISAPAYQPAPPAAAPWWRPGHAVTTEEALSAPLTFVTSSSNFSEDEQTAPPSDERRRSAATEKPAATGAGLPNDPDHGAATEERAATVAGLTNDPDHGAATEERAATVAGLTNDADHGACRERERHWSALIHRLQSQHIQTLERHDRLLGQMNEMRRLTARLRQLRQKPTAAAPAPPAAAAVTPAAAAKEPPPIADNERQELYHKYQLLVRRNIHLEAALKQAHRQAALLAAPTDPAHRRQHYRDELEQYRALVKLQMTSAVEDYQAERREKERLQQLNAQLQQQLERLRAQLPAPQLPPPPRPAAPTPRLRDRPPLPPPGHAPLRYTGSLPCPTELRVAPAPTGASRSVEEVLNCSIEELMQDPPPPPRAPPPPRPPPGSARPTRPIPPPPAKERWVEVDRVGRIARNSKTSSLARRRVVSNSVPPPKAATPYEEPRDRDEVSAVVRTGAVEVGRVGFDDAVGGLPGDRSAVDPAAGKKATVRDSGYCDWIAAPERGAELEPALTLVSERSDGASLRAQAGPSVTRSSHQQKPNVPRTMEATAGGEVDSVDKHRTDDSARACDDHRRTSVSTGESAVRPSDGLLTNPGMSDIYLSCVPGAGIPSDDWTMVGTSWLPAAVADLTLLPATLPGGVEDEGAAGGNPRVIDPHTRTRGVRGKTANTMFERRRRDGDSLSTADEYADTNTRNDVTCLYCGQMFAHAQHLLYLDHLESCPGRRTPPR